jgi:hypothetical protein
MPFLRRRNTPMLKKQDFAVIKALAEHAIYSKNIAVELGVHPRLLDTPASPVGVPYNPPTTPTATTGCVKYRRHAEAERWAGHPSL